MSTAGELLTSGFLVNLRIHGEPLGYISAANVVRAEHGEAITSETGGALLIDDTETAITGIWDDAFISPSAFGGEAATMEIAAIVKSSDVTGIARGAVIVRSDVQYYVNEVQTAAIDGSQVLILTRQAH